MASVDSDANSTSQASSCRELKRRRIVQPDGEHDVEDSIVVSVPPEERPRTMQADSQSSSHIVTLSESGKIPVSSTAEFDLAIIRAREALMVTPDASNTVVSIPPPDSLPRENNRLQDSLGSIAGTTVRHSPKPDSPEAGAGMRFPPDLSCTTSSVTPSDITKPVAASPFPNPPRPINTVKDEDSNLLPPRGKRSSPSHNRVLSEPHGLASRIVVGRQNSPPAGQTMSIQKPPNVLSPQPLQLETQIPSIFSSLSDLLPKSKADSYQESNRTSQYSIRQYSRAPEQSNDQGTIYTKELVQHQPGDTVSDVRLPPLQLPITIKGAFNRNNSRLKGSRAGSKFDTTAKVIIRQRSRTKQHRTSVDSDTLLSLPIGVLMSRELVPFFEWYAFKANSSNVVWLKFEFIDVDWQPARIIFISRNDHIGYASLKSHVSNLFYFALNKNQSMTEFRVSVSPDGDTAHINPSVILTRLTDRIQRLDHQTESTRHRASSQNDHRQPLPEVLPSDAKSSAVVYSSPPLRESPSPIATINGISDFSSRSQVAPNRRDSYGTSRGFLSNESMVIGSHLPNHSSHAMINSSSQLPSQVQAHRPHSFSEPSDTVLPEIVVLIQQADGKLSQPYPKDVLHPRINSSEFFSWFGARSGFGTASILPELQFTFKDALPVPKTNVVAIGNEDHFNYMRADIKTKCERAKWFRPAMKEFVVLVTLPGWETAGTEEVDW